MAYSALTIANYFIKKSHDESRSITPLKVIKLVYLAHAWNLAILQKPLIDEAVYAWKWGPVIKGVYHEFKKYGNQNIELLADAPPLDKQDKFTPLILEKIWKEYGEFSGLQLVNLTHEEETPWEAVWNKQGGKNKRNAVIPNPEIKKFYETEIRVNR